MEAMYKAMHLRFQADVCRRCGMNAEADALEAEAQRLLDEDRAALDRQAGIVRG